MHKRVSFILLPVVIGLSGLLFFISATETHALTPSWPTLPTGYYYLPVDSLQVTRYTTGDVAGNYIDCDILANIIACKGHTYTRPGNQPSGVAHYLDIQPLPPGVVAIAMYLEYINSSYQDKLYTRQISTGHSVEATTDQFIIIHDHVLSLTTGFDVVRASDAPLNKVVQFVYNKTSINEWRVHYIFIANTPPDGGGDPGGGGLGDITGTLPYSINCSYVVSSELPGQVTETVVVSTNLVENSSFEAADGQRPLGWVPSLNGTVYQGTNHSYYSHFYARSGSRSLASSDNFFIVQGITVQSGEYLVGMMVRCFADEFCTPEQAAFVWSGVTLASISPLTDTGWTLITATVSTGGGSPLIGIQFSEAGLSGTVYVDDVFVVPYDAVNNQVLCQAEYYQDTEDPPDDSDDSEDDYPIIPDGSFGVCYDCVFPANLLAIGQWVRWLGCQLHNLFYCSLRIWLLILANWLFGVYDSISTIFSYVLSLVSEAIAWTVSLINGVLGLAVATWNLIRTSVTNFLVALMVRVIQSGPVQALWSFATAGGLVFEIVWGGVQTFITLILTIYNGLINLITLVIEFVQAISAAWRAEPYELDMFPGYGANDISKTNTVDWGTPGPTPGKLFWVLVVPIAAIDTYIDQYLPVLIPLMIGMIGFYVVIWTLRQFHEIYPI